MEVLNNDTYIDLFLLEAGKTIESGNIVYIKNAIKKDEDDENRKKLFSSMYS